MKRAHSLVLCTLLAACSGSDGDGNELLFDVPEPPEGGFQIVGQPHVVPAGAEQFICQQVPFDVTEETIISESKVYQAPGGHHVIIFYSTSMNTDPAPHECGGSDMTDVRLVGVGSGYGKGVELPEGKGLRLPAGAKLYYQSHYVNATDSDMEVQDVVNFATIPPGDMTDLVGSFAQVDLTFALPPKQETTRTLRCEIPFEMHLANLLPHMHEWGTHFRAHVERGDQRIDLFDVDWDAAFRDDFPWKSDADELVFQQGDILQTECTWYNDEDQVILFPKEMCATFFMFYPSPNGALMACDESGDLQDV